MEEVDRTVNHMQDDAANFLTQLTEQLKRRVQHELRTRDRERKLMKIDKTIDMLETDDFGYCETCGIEIGLRVWSCPTATQCVDCKALDEIKERQIHG